MRRGIATGRRVFGHKPRAAQMFMARVEAHLTRPLVGGKVRRDYCMADLHYWDHSINHGVDGPSH